MRTRILLAGAHSALKDLVRRIESCADLDLVAWIMEEDPIETLLRAEECEPDICVLACDKEIEPGICSHLFDQNPQLFLIVVRSPTRGALFLERKVTRRRLPEADAADILAAIRSSAST